MLNIHKIYLFVGLIFFSLQSTVLIAQHSSFTQFRPEIDIATKPFKKTTFQLDLSTQRESDVNATNMFKYASSVSGKIWVSHYFKSKVKSSAFFETIYNKYVPEVNSADSYEYRIGIQNSYTKPLGRVTISNTFRVEDRILEDKTGKYVQAIRARYKIKMYIGLTKKNLIKGAVYFLGTNEFFFNMGSTATGYHLFEQDAVELGLGYCISDYITIESLYNYTFRRMPYDGSGTRTIQAWQLTLSFNNVFSGAYLQGYFHKK